MDDELLATLIRRTHLGIRRRVHADLQRAGFTDLAPAHVYVFQRPGPDGARPTELAARTNMTKQAMNHLLADLEGRGYITRVPAPDDGRGKVVRLTRRGKRLVEAMQDSARRVEAEWAARLGRPKVEALRAALHEVDRLGNGAGTE